MAKSEPMTEAEEKYKADLEKRLIEVYGEDFKTPLAADLVVDVSTVRRAFNRPRPLSSLFAGAVEHQLGSMGKLQMVKTENSIRTINVGSLDDDWNS